MSEHQVHIGELLDSLQQSYQQYLTALRKASGRCRTLGIELHFSQDLGQYRKDHPVVGVPFTPIFYLQVIPQDGNFGVVWQDLVSDRELGERDLRTVYTVLGILASTEFQVRCASPFGVVSPRVRWYTGFIGGAP